MKRASTESLDIGILGKRKTSGRTLRSERLRYPLREAPEPLGHSLSYRVVETTVLSRYLEIEEVDDLQFKTCYGQYNPLLPRVGDGQHIPARGSVKYQGEVEKCGMPGYGSLRCNFAIVSV